MKSIFYFIIPVILLLAACTPSENKDRGYIVKVGDPAPDFEFELTDGSKAKLHDFRGQIIMLQFTASWCKVCREEMPYIERDIWQVFKDDGLVLLGIDRDEPRDTVIAFGKKMQVSYPLALDPGAGIFKLFAHEKAGITRNVIIDRDGQIAYLTRLFNEEEFYEMRDVIANLLND